MGEILGLIAAGIVVLILIRCGWAAVKAVINQAIEWERARIDTARQRADIALVRPDSITGLLPVHRAMIESCTDAALAMMAARIDSMRLPANVPHTLHYHVENKGGTGMEPAMIMQPPAIAPIVPSFRELFRSGVISPNRLMLGCQEDGQPRHGALGDVYSCLIIAKSGAGKTTLQRFLLAQACGMGAKIAIVDPHGRTSQGLAAALSPLSAHQLFEPAIDDGPIDHAVQYFMRLVENRVNRVDTSEDVRILAVDEVNLLIDDLGDKFAADLTRLAERGRKAGVFVFAAGQSAEASRTGGDARLRKAFCGRYVLRSDRDAVQRMISDRDLLDRVPNLSPGQSIYVPTRDLPVPLMIPDTTEADLRDCFGSQVVEPVPSSVVESVPFSVPQLIHDPLSWVDTGSRAELVRQLFKSGKSQTEIIAEVWGITRKGRAWAQAAVELNTIFRSLM